MAAQTYERAREAAIHRDAHLGTPGSRELGAAMAKALVTELCFGRLRTIYYRPARGKWEAFGIACDRCGSLWRRPRPSDA